MSIYDTLNTQQQEAVFHTEGPVLILAGAGSGKTRVLTHRIAYLIEEKGVNPWNIMAITFTNKAAGEMRERVDKIVGFGSESIWVSTFHSSCVRMLRRFIDRLGFDTNFTIYDTDDQKTLMKDICKRLDIDTKIYKERSIMAAISSAKDELIGPEEYELKVMGDFSKRKIALAYKEYQKELKKNNALDFDDLIMKTVELFQACPDVLEYFQERFKYIMVDEYQDTNTAQFKFVSLLAGKYRNLCVVGDDDQSIYRFRGSKPEIMLGFEKDYPNAKRILLDTNYRCGRYIVEASLNLISHNRERFDKKIIAASKSKAPVTFADFENRRDENIFLIRDIDKKIKAGAVFSDFAVLFRTNTQPRQLIEQLMSYNIPFKTKDNIPNIYEHWIARDLFTYQRIAGGSRDRADFLQIMNRPKRYLSRDSLCDATVAFDEWIKLFDEKPWIAERIEKLEYDMKLISRMNPYASINYIRRGIGYDDFLAEYAEYRNINKEDLFDILDEIQSGAKGFATYEEWYEHIREYTKQMKLMALSKESDPNAVTLATLHSSKGLEFENVYIIDANEGIMPYKKAVLEKDIEEERRLFYVGMTRAKTSLSVYSVKSVNDKSAQASRFVRESKEPRQNNSRDD